MNQNSFRSAAGVLAGVPATLAGALGGAPWWAVALMVTATMAFSIAVPLSGLVLEHLRQRKGDMLDTQFESAVADISDPEKRIEAILKYRRLTGQLGSEQWRDPPAAQPLDPVEDGEGSGPQAPN
ncbi:hypothetical protein [Nocardia sp. NPDC127526]|uniref:hypothetical protein n=1 Tax=Nocardia sp. NPDC127526 TaxID=3345393 RepID=UPI00362BED84